MVFDGNLNLKAKKINDPKSSNFRRTLKKNLYVIPSKVLQAKMFYGIKTKEIDEYRAYYLVSFKNSFVQFCDYELESFKVKKLKCHIVHLENFVC